MKLSTRLQAALIASLLPVFGGYALYLAEFRDNGNLRYLALVVQLSFAHLRGAGFWQFFIAFVLCFLLQRRAQV